MNKEYVLPEKWYVVVTDKNIDILIEWLYEVKYVSTAIEFGNIIGYCEDSTEKEWDDGVNEYWKNEITFEQFKQYILNGNEYVPFDFDDDLVGTKIMTKDKSCKQIITYQSEFIIKLGHIVLDYVELFDEYILYDGSPCGKLKQTNK